LSAPDETRVALNLGGIANLSVLAAGASAGELIAFDSGPANLPIDTYVEWRTGGRERYDRDGAYAAAGTVDAALLATLLDDPYLRAAPPKSTGRERYGAAYVAQLATRLDALPLRDAVATLTAVTVESVAKAVRRYAPAAVRVIASGGGVHNRALMAGLAAALPGVRVESSAAFGVDPDAKEALAFAILGREALAERPAGLPRVTGASGPRVLGAIAPAALAALVARVGGEEAAR
jgi:anhydro-N-acetylmuramic acid kinase